MHLLWLLAATRKSTILGRCWCYHRIMFHHFPISRWHQCWLISRFHGPSLRLSENTEAPWTWPPTLWPCSCGQHRKSSRGRCPCARWPPRVLLMCDVASALLLIQLGQFTHPATGLVLNNTDFPFDISIYLYMFGFVHASVCENIGIWYALIWCNLI